MRLEEGICLHDFGADAALDGGFDFGLCAGADAVRTLVKGTSMIVRAHELFFEHLTRLLRDECGCIAPAVIVMNPTTVD